MKRFFTLSILTFLFSLSLSAQVLTWNFFGVNAGPNTLSSSTNDPSVMPSTLSRGSLAVANGNVNNSFRTTGFKNDGISTSNNDYFQFTVQANTNSVVSITGITATFAGTASYTVSPGVMQQFAYSLDGTNFTLIGTAVTTIGTPQTNTFTFDATTLAALSDVPSSTIVTFRYYASGQTATGGWGFNSAVSATTNNLTIMGNSVLPLTISDLNATKQTSSVALGWSLGCTSNEVTYAVERSANGTSFGSIETKTVSQQRCSQPFQFTDASPLNGTNYYRIKSSNIDGEVKYSGIATVKFEGSKGIKVFPTATTGTTTIYYETSDAGTTIFNVMDINGRVVKSISFNVTSGVNNLPLNISELAAGKYIIVGLQNNNKIPAVSIIKQ